MVLSYRIYPEQHKVTGTYSGLATILIRFLRTRIWPWCTIISTHCEGLSQSERPSQDLGLTCITSIPRPLVGSIWILAE